MFHHLGKAPFQNISAVDTADHCVQSTCIPSPQTILHSCSTAATSIPVRNSLGFPVVFPGQQTMNHILLGFIPDLGEQHGDVSQRTSATGNRPWTRMSVFRMAVGLSRLSAEFTTKPNIKQCPIIPPFHYQIDNKWRSAWQGLNQPSVTFLICLAWVGNLKAFVVVWGLGGG